MGIPQGGGPDRVRTRERSRLARWIGPVLVALAFVALVLAVAVDHGSAAAHVDEPIERWVVAQRTPGWTAFFRPATHLGEPGVMFALGVVLAVVAAFRSRTVALAVALVTLARPLASTVVKSAVDRPRPQLSQLTTATGGSFPSGHTLGAAVLWGSVPAVLMAWSASRALIRTAVVAAVVLTLVVACSRVYLGVHWFTDVVGGALLGALLLMPVYRVARAPVPTMDP